MSWIRLVSHALVLVMMQVCRAIASDIVLGQSATFSGPSSTGGIPYTLGLQAAFFECNNSGGVYGRNISLISMDDQYVVARTVNNTKALVANPNVLALVGLFGSSQVLTASAYFNGTLCIGPMTGSAVFRTTFNPSIINIRAGYNDEAIVILRFLVQQLHFKRFAILYQNDTLGIPPLGVLVAALSNMGLSPVFLFPYTSAMLSTINYTSLGANITAANPQAVLMYCVAGFAQNMITGYYASGGSTNIIFTIASNAADAFKAYLKLRNLPSTNVYATQIVPLLESTTSQAVIRFRNAVDTYSATLVGGTVGSYDYLSLEGYVVGRTVIEMLKTVQVTLTRASFVDAVYRTRFFQVDDLLIGPLSQNCDFNQDDAVGRSSMCNCTQGLRLVGITAIDANYSYYAAASVFSFPMAECWAPASLVKRPTQGGVPYLPDRTTGGAAALSTGFTFNSALQVPSLIALNGSASPIPASNVSSVMNSTYISLVLGLFPVAAIDGIIVASGIAGGSIHSGMTIPLVSGGINGATGVRRLRRERLFLMPPLEVEVHAVCTMLNRLAIPLVRLIISDTAHRDTNVANALELSSKTLGIIVQSVVVFTDSAGLAAAIAGSTHVGVFVLIGGISSASMMTSALAAIATAFAAQSQLRFGFFGAEMAANWDSIPALATDAYLGSITFATSLPLWTNASSSSFSAKYLSDLSSATAAQRAHPNTAIGYLTAGLMAYLEARASTLDPATVLDTVYQFSIASISDVTLGPFADVSTCSSTQQDVTQDGTASSCGCNNGVRKVFFHTPLDVNRKFTSSSVSNLVTFTSCMPSYVIPAAAEASMVTTIVAAVVPSAGAVLIGVVVFFYCTSGRDNRRAPKDPNQPCAMVFTDIQSSTALWARAPDAMAVSIDQHHDALRILVAKHRGYEVKTIGDSFMVAFKAAKDAASFAIDIQSTLYNMQWPAGIDETYIELAEEAANAEAVFSMSGGSASASGSASINPSNAVQPSASQQVNYWEDPVTYTKSWNGIRVRVGMHWGLASIKFDPVSQGYDYYGTLVNTAARVEGVGNGGQVLATKDMFDRLEEEDFDMRGVTVTPLGPQPLRGLDNPVPLFQMCPLSLKSRQFNPLRLDVEIDLESDSTATGTGDGSTVLDEDTWERLFEAAHKRRKDATQHTRDAALIVINFLTTALKMMPPNFRKDTLSTLAKKWHIKLRHPPKKEPYDRTMMFDIVLVTNKIGPVADEARRAALKNADGMAGSTTSAQFQASTLRRQSMRRPSKQALTALSAGALVGLEGLAAPTVPTPVSPSLSP